MKREIIDHKVNGLNEAIRITVEDEPGAGGANHVYALMLPYETTMIRFQNGPINDAGINGLSNEALLAVVVDRIRGFQSGEYACRENAIALTSLEEALMWLQKRTRDRMARGVEGTPEK